MSITNSSRKCKFQKSSHDEIKLLGNKFNHELLHFSLTVFALALIGKPQNLNFKPEIGMILKAIGDSLLYRNLIGPMEAVQFLSHQPPQLMPC